MVCEVSYVLAAQDQVSLFSAGDVSKYVKWNKIQTGAIVPKTRETIVFAGFLRYSLISEAILNHNELGGITMTISKDRLMQGMQRFGGAMYTPVILFAFFGLTVALSIICKNESILGSIAAQGTVWYDFWFVVEQGAWTVFAQSPFSLRWRCQSALRKKSLPVVQWKVSSSICCLTISLPGS